MALIGITVTLGAAATQVTSSVLFCPWVRIENEAGNALVKFGDSAVSATDYFGSVPADTATVSNAVSIGQHVSSSIRLDHLYLLGTAAQKVHVTAITP